MKISLPRTVHSVKVGYNLAPGRDSEEECFSHFIFFVKKSPHYTIIFKPSG